VPNLNTPGDDSRPNVRSDGREIVFDRSAKIGGPADIYAATRTTTADTWSSLVKLDASVNTPANESRASLSSDGRTLLFGSNRPGSEPDAATGKPSNDIYVTKRTSARTVGISTVVGREIPA
jgi:Tol biopolymer transport system component